MRLQLRDHQQATLLSLKIPTLPADPADKGRIYPDLQLSTGRPSKWQPCHSSRLQSKSIGKYSETWKCVLGKHVVNQINKGRLLLEFCAGQFTITNISQSEDHMDAFSGQDTGTQLTML